MDHGLYYPAMQNEHLQAFSDANYTGDIDIRRSMAGFILKLGEATIA